MNVVTVDRGAVENGKTNCAILSSEDGIDNVVLWFDVRMGFG
jgi:hypothetical protein